MDANKAHFLDLILKMGWWSEEDIEWVKVQLFIKVSVIYITLSYQSGFLLDLYRVMFFLFFFIVQIFSFLWTSSFALAFFKCELSILEVFINLS